MVRTTRFRVRGDSIAVKDGSAGIEGSKVAVKEESPNNKQNGATERQKKPVHPLTRRTESSLTAMTQRFGQWSGYTVTCNYLRGDIPPS
jgi:hypothetical protein